jgi:hypothetical protein
VESLKAAFVACWAADVFKNSKPSKFHIPRIKTITRPPRAGAEKHFAEWSECNKKSVPLRWSARARLSFAMTGRRGERTRARNCHIFLLSACTLLIHCLLYDLSNGYAKETCSPHSDGTSPSSLGHQTLCDGEKEKPTLSPLLFRRRQRR